MMYFMCGKSQIHEFGFTLQYMLQSHDDSVMESARIWQLL